MVWGIIISISKLFRNCPELFDYELFDYELFDYELFDYELQAIIRASEKID